MRASTLLPVLASGAALAGVAAPAAAGPGPDPAHLVAEAVAEVRSRLAAERIADRHYASLTGHDAALLFTFPEADRLEVALGGGVVVVDGKPVARYTPHGPLDLAWRTLVTEAGDLPVHEAVARLRAWRPEAGEADAAAATAVRRTTRKLQAPRGSPPDPRPVPQAGAGGPTLALADLRDRLALEDRLRALLGDSLPAGFQLTVPDGQARLGDFSIGSNETLHGHLLVLRGHADVYGRLVGNLVTFEGDVILHRGAVIEGDVLAIGGRVRDGGGVITGEIASLADMPAVPARAATAPAGPARRTLHRLIGLFGTLATLALIGFGIVVFARPQLEVVSDTVAVSFGRAFVTGLVGQVLLVPTFGMLVVGLALSIVGVVLIPFVVVAYVLLAILGVLGGAVAVAHAMGETWTRRRLAQGVALSANSHRYVLTGLLGFLGLWGVWALTGWVPVAGTLVWGAAALATWFLATAGFGALLLSRAGLRENFTGRLLPPEALTDEYLWATPQFGVPAARRTPPRPPDDPRP